MPALDPFGQRKPSQPPTLWLVPRWWAFSRDDRYKVDLVKGGNRGRTQYHSRPVNLQNGGPSRHQQPTSNEGRKLSTKHKDLPKAVREQFLSIHEASSKSPIFTTDSVEDKSRHFDTEFSGAFLVSPKSFVNGMRLNPIDQNDDPTQSKLCIQNHHRPCAAQYQQTRRLPILQKRGQTERHLPRTPSFQKNPRVLAHELSLLAVKTNDVDSVLTSTVPTKLSFLHPSAAIDHHRQFSNAWPDSTPYEDDPVYGDETIEQQSKSFQALLINKDCLHQPWPKHGSQAPGHTTSRELLLSPVTDAHPLADPDLFRSPTTHLGSKPHVPIPHTCARSDALPGYYTSNVGSTDVGYDFQQAVKAPQCPLHSISIDQRSKAPLESHPIPYDQACECFLHTPRRSGTDYSPHVPPHQQSQRPRQMSNDVCQQSHVHVDALHELLSRYLSNDHATHQKRVNLQQPHNYHPETQNHKPDNLCDHPRSAHNMLPKYQAPEGHITRIDRHDHPDLTKRNDYRQFHSTKCLPAMYLSNRPTHHHEIVNQPRHCEEYGCGQPGSLDCGYKKGRRTSYVRTRRE